MRVDINFNMDYDLIDEKFKKTSKILVFPYPFYFEPEELFEHWILLLCRPSEIFYTQYNINDFPLYVPLLLMEGCSTFILFDGVTRLRHRTICYCFTSPKLAAFLKLHDSLSK